MIVKSRGSDCQQILKIFVEIAPRRSPILFQRAIFAHAEFSRRLVRRTAPPFGIRMPNIFAIFCRTGTVLPALS
jgi:hypothetical protein